MQSIVMWYWESRAFGTIQCRNELYVPLWTRSHSSASFLSASNGDGQGDVVAFDRGVKVYRMQNEDANFPFGYPDYTKPRPFKSQPNLPLSKSGNPLFINKIKLSKWDFRLLPCLLCWNLRLWNSSQTNWSHVSMLPCRAFYGRFSREISKAH